MQISQLCFALALSAGGMPLAAADCSAASGSGTTALLELYTSEGCSSCPPADRWLGGLARRYDATRLIPLALHVDYWDYIGWKDRYAQPAFAERQRSQARLGGFVYTPQLMLNGRDLRGWSSAASFDAALAAISRTPARAALQLSLSRSGSELDIRVTAQASGRDTTQLYVALYENALSTAVQAGENDGSLLRHDRVVRLWLGPFDSARPWARRIPLAADWKTRDLGVVAFVQEPGGQVLQAVSRHLCAAAS